MTPGLHTLRAVRVCLCWHVDRERVIPVIGHLVPHAPCLTPHPWMKYLTGLKIGARIVPFCMTWAESSASWIGGHYTGSKYLVVMLFWLWLFLYNLINQDDVEEPTT